MHRLRLTVVIAAPLLLGAAIAVAPTAPISLDRLGLEHPAFLLDGGGRIVVAERDPDFPTRVLATVPAEFKGLDLLTAEAWGIRRLFVSAYGLTSQDSRARLFQYSESGKRQCEWIVPDISAGIDIDINERAVYLAGASNGIVYRLRLGRDGCSDDKPAAVFQIRQATRLGPLIVDSNARALYVADLRGALYRIDLRRGAVVEVAASLGQPVALAYDRKSALLYVADSAGRRIWRIDVKQANAQPAVLSRDPAFQEPSSLTFASDGNLLIGDRRAAQIFVITKSKEQTANIPGRRPAGRPNLRNHKIRKTSRQYPLR